ncbi:MAG: RNA 2',3'-cyclic phosphodiesterase [Candidatus Altiarchaeales archaeon]|nr:MAG: RNA 2',3'-cyclic phosphodiesterase [Candidatus Altiarchaeales archaeon]RLI94478.1 MAG: RNA 2',3'-cyclic phosphodiesterase [Candidatus Altiarchaeales archaeon]RLI94484.1 MAG: RNA 2',3'-cyclic phosphodiesterase [Candidatus Altiarchaeales archaeon]HDO82300.1 RNA 2',3'-cyclic phosphodiesterase [Candidatus Altiarchaeales archaeon]HEX54949.1 RNA 2',3'-cyclic phosphodiesterase [Candidatus Altiarchaeales archaeon]
MPRAFIAIPCPENLKNDMLEIQKKIRDMGGFKFVERENIHLTLKFLGNVEDEAIEKIKNELKFLSEIGKFHISLRGIGAFPSLNYIRVVWIGVEEDGILREIQRKIDNRLNKFGFKAENRFHPHFTIARARFISDKNNLMKFITENKDKWFGEFTVDRIELMESKLSHKGPKYYVLYEFKLKC